MTHRKLLSVTPFVALAALAPGSAVAWDVYDCVSAALEIMQGSDYWFQYWLSNGPSALIQVAIDVCV